ncbi:hypothetical protein LXL04_029985 [Taraxacum kok-saghyz]
MGPGGLLAVDLKALTSEDSPSDLDEESPVVVGMGASDEREVNFLLVATWVSTMESSIFGKGGVELYARHYTFYPRYICHWILLYHGQRYLLQSRRKTTLYGGKSMYINVNICGVQYCLSKRALVERGDTPTYIATYRPCSHRCGIH